MSENRGESEYSLHYFGFTPETFYKDFSELILEEMSNTVKQSMQELTSLKSSLLTEDEMRQHTLEVYHKWCDQSNTILAKTEPMIKSFFVIPKNVLLESEQVYKTTYSEDEVLSLEKEVDELKEQYIRQLRGISLCKLQLAKANSFEPIITKVDEGVAALQPIVKTIEEIKSLEKIIKEYMESRAQLFRNEESEDSDNEENEYQSGFKVLEE